MRRQARTQSAAHATHLAVPPPLEHVLARGEGGGGVEAVGTVRDTGAVSPLRVAAFGDDFDLKNYDDLVGLAGDKYAALFR